MRVTKQKSLVLDIINKSYNHLSAEEIYHECQLTLPNISLGTVYRILNQLTDSHQIKRLKVQGFDRFDALRNKHNHFICSKCSRIYDIFNDIIDLNMINVPGKVYDYDINFMGLCNDCLQNEED